MSIMVTSSRPYEVREDFTNGSGWIIKVDNTTMFPKIPTLADGEAFPDKEALADVKDLPDSDALLVPGS